MTIFDNSMIRCSVLATISSSPAAPLASIPNERGALVKRWHTCFTNSFSNSSKNFLARLTIGSRSSLVKLTLRKPVVNSVHQRNLPENQATADSAECLIYLDGRATDDCRLIRVCPCGIL